MIQDTATAVANLNGLVIAGTCYGTVDLQY